MTLALTRSGKPTDIRDISVRETGISRHLGGTIEPPPLKAPVHHSTTILRGLMAALNWAPIMTRDASLSDSQ